MAEEKSPLVSVITPFYNRAAYVEESVKSLLSQTYPNLEILIINDASTDDTLAKINEVVAGDQRARVINNESNKGLVHSLMDTVKEAKGEFIAIHGSGDISMPTRIEKQAEALRKDPKLVLVGCFVKKETESGNQELRKREIPPFLESNLLIKSAFNHGDVMFKKQAYINAGGYRKFFKYGQDRDLWLRMVKQGDFGIVEQPLYLIKHIKNSVSKNPKKRFEQRLYSNYARMLYLSNLEGKNSSPMEDPEGLYDIYYGNFAKREILIQTEDFTDRIIPELERIMNKGHLDVLERLFLIASKRGKPFFANIILKLLKTKQNYVIRKAQKNMEKGPLEVFKILNS
ncbi:glycosyltransferase family 2 protein [Pleomorphovibrio marinus]|uniref:glycosyltransferase family 2 protein n=1 Tax=Pleomorphovibrio marinus TaxID=2164132 RepID=UPI000E0B3B80|nr:glycosyltransferase family A protein [Pleomorphovibrio marinus]